MSSDYCPSRHRTVRRLTRVVNVGGVAVGGTNPLRLQSMTTSDTEDIAATVAQAIRLNFSIYEDERLIPVARLQ